MIQLYHVHKSYGADVPALIDLTLEIAKGEFVFVTGPSGAGKSTLLRLIFSAERPNRGQLLVNGRNTSRLRASAIPYLRRNIGVVFQDFKLLPQRTVEENVGIVLEVMGLPRRDIRRRTFTLLKQLGLAHKMHQLPPRLSGGEQQRVAIARALINEPQILLADEPTGNLDPERSEEIMGLLQAANARGTTVVVATHDKALMSRLDKRIIALENGRLTE
ncbi:MAG TPA: cell division ATP-binding protein FtsE [Myxococcota bacterium]|nr:cell division ATP-binding protein FtsE [Myxococcota bacterium]